MFRFRGTTLCIGMATFGRSEDRAGRKPICVPRGVPHESPMFRTCAPNLHRLGASRASTIFCKPLPKRVNPHRASCPTSSRFLTGIRSIPLEPPHGRAAGAPQPVCRMSIKGPVSMPVKQLRRPDAACFVPGFHACLRQHPGSSRACRRNGGPQFPSERCGIRASRARLCPRTIRDAARQPAATVKIASGSPGRAARRSRCIASWQ